MNKNIAATVIAIGLIGLGITLGLLMKQGISSISESKRTLAVKGLSEREVKANKVTWPVVYKVIGNDMQTIYNQIEASNKIIISYLSENGLAAEDFTTSAPKVFDKQAERYSNDVVGTRFTATGVIIVTTDKVDLVRKLIQNQGELMKKGVAISISDYEYNTIYEYTDLNTIKPEMIAEATQKAREAAQKFADDSGSKVGKIMSASQGQFSIDDRDPYTPFIKKVRVVTVINYSIDD